MRKAEIKIFVYYFDKFTKKMHKNIKKCCKITTENKEVIK